MGWLIYTLCSLVPLFVATNGGFLLPENISPQHYDLQFLFDIDQASNFSFYGVVDILLSVKTSTSKIVLHAKGFEIEKEKVTLTGTSTTEYIVQNVILNGTYDFLTISIDKTLDEGGNYTLTIPFYGNLKLGLDGVYLSSYDDKSTKKKEYLITTQFEALSARLGFPCFDEPMFKATYSLRIGRPSDYTTISNMPLKTSAKVEDLSQDIDWKTISEKFIGKPASLFIFDEFEKSVPMSTYLVAFVVSKFKYQESPKELSKATFKIWARQDAINQTTYAANIGPRVLTHFEEWFNVSFPLPKQDMVAIPDFSAGAMENWGLITYRETTLLYDEKVSSILNKERIASVVAHELAHQWFGNLVTMKWWSDLWLNEGFATFVQSLGMSMVEPTFRAPEVQGAQDMLIVLKADALESSHPVLVPLDDPQRISEIFDAISYKKGSTLIRSMTKFLGMDVFRKAINAYLVKYSYKNAQQDDLWAELTAVSQQYSVLTRNVTIKQIMDTWTTQTGYPVLTVNRNYQDKSLTIRQRRYLAVGSRAKTTSSWWVPLHVLTQSDVSREAGPVQWLSDQEGTDDEYRFQHDADTNDWVLFNVDMIALCRVNYDERNWELLIQTLTEGDLASVPMLSRVQLIADVFALASTDYLPYDTAFKLVSYLQRETEYLPLNTGLEELARVDRMLMREAQYGVYLKFARRIIGDRYEALGKFADSDDQDLMSVKMKVRTNAFACHVKVAGCEEAAVQLFSTWMQSEDPDTENPIPSDYRSTVYCAGVRRGNVAHWQFLLERLRRTEVATAKETLLFGLTCTRDVWLLRQLLEMSLTENPDIRRQNSAYVIKNVLKSGTGYYVTRDLIYNDIEKLHNAFKHNPVRLGEIIKTLLDQFTTQQELDDFEAWYKKNKKYLEAAKLTVAQGMENARVNIQWVRRHRDHLVKLMDSMAAGHEDLYIRNIAVTRKTCFIRSCVIAILLMKSFEC